MKQQTLFSLCRPQSQHGFLLSASRFSFSEAISGGATECAEALRDSVSAHLPASFRIAFLNVLASLNVLRDLPDRAAAPLIQAQEMAERFGYRLYQPHLIDTEGQRLMALGAFDAAIDHFIRAGQSEALHSDAASHSLVVGHLGTAWRRTGDIGRALDVYARAADIAASTRNLYTQLTCASNMAYSQGLSGSPDAIGLLAKLREQATQAGLGFVANKCALFGAVLTLRQHGGPPDLAALQIIVNEMVAQGQINFLCSELCQHPDLTTKVCQVPRREAWLTELVSCLSRHAGSESALEQVAAIDADLARLVVDHAVTRLPAANARALLDRLRRSSSPEVRRAARPVKTRKKAQEGMPELTDRETRVLQLMASGLRNQDIASRLYLSEATVKSYVNRIFRKLGVIDRVGAVLCYRDRMGDPREVEARSP